MKGETTQDTRTDKLEPAWKTVYMTTEKKHPGGDGSCGKFKNGLKHNLREEAGGEEARQKSAGAR